MRLPLLRIVDPTAVSGRGTAGVNLSFPMPQSHGSIYIIGALRDETVFRGVVFLLYLNRHA